MSIPTDTPASGSRIVRGFVTITILVVLTSSVFAQRGINFINKTGLKVWVQKRTVLEQGFYPYVLEAGVTGYQNVPLQIQEPLILNIVVVPEKGPYGTADGIYYLLKPGDSLLITVDQNRKPVLSHVSNPARTNELTFIRKHMASVGKTLPYTLFGFKGNIALNKVLQSSDLQSRDRALDSLYRPYINTAESFAKQNRMDPAVGRLYKNFYWGSLICDKLFVDRNINESLQQSLLTFYADSVIAWSARPLCSDCNNVPHYKNALFEIYAMRFGRSSDPEFLDAVQAQASGTMRSFLLSRFMIVRMELVHDPEKLLARYDALCSDPVYRDLVDQAYRLHAQQTQRSQGELATLTRPDKSTLGFRELLDQLKGCVMYVDFWASWCGPCVAEFPASHQLKENVRDFNIKMIYISVDTDFNSWIKARDKFKVNDSLSFILDNPEKNEWVKKIGLGPIPRYLIIDRKGEIVRLDATRPSDPKTYQTLLDILTKGD